MFRFVFASPAVPLSLAMKHRPPQPYRRRYGVSSPLTLITLSCTSLFFILHSRTPSFSKPDPLDLPLPIQSEKSQTRREVHWTKPETTNASRSRCATVEEMGQSLSGSGSESGKESLRIREIIRRHFDINGALHLVKVLICQCTRKNS